MHKPLSAQKNPLLTGTLILTLAGLISRGLGFFYRLFLAQTFGEEAMGLLQLISPVIMIAFSLTCAGMQTSISRYTASCIADGHPETARRFLLLGSCFCLALSSVYALIIYQQAESISAFLLKEPRLTILLKIISFSLPLASLHSCLNGYFYGRKEVRIPAFCQLAEQLARTGSVFLVCLLLPAGKQPSIALAALGTVLGELVSCLISYLAYFYLSEPAAPAPSSSAFCKKKRFSNTLFKKESPSSLLLLKQLLSMALPLSLNRLIVNFLQSVEAVSIPQKLQAYGYSSETALSIYGVLTGMAFSLILFPSAFTQSASVLLLPEVTGAAASSTKERLRHTISRSLFACTALGLLFCCIFFTTGNLLGEILFHSRLAGTFICQLSFLCPFLYLHAALSSVLNGLKKTLSCLFINVFSLGIRLVFTLYLIPVTGIKGYLWGLLCSELFSTFVQIWLIRRELYRAAI